MFGGFGIEKLLLVVIVLLLLFGARRIPEIGHALGKSIRDFKGGLRGHDAVPPPRDDQSRSRVAESAPEPRTTTTDAPAAEPRRLLP